MGCKLLCLVASAEDANEREGNGEAGDGTIDMDVDATSGTAVAVSGTTRGGVGNVAGHFLVAFNNADATDSVKLVEKFARELLKKRAGAASGASEEFFKTLPNLAAVAERELTDELLQRWGELQPVRAKVHGRQMITEVQLTRVHAPGIDFHAFSQNFQKLVVLV